MGRTSPGVLRRGCRRDKCPYCGGTPGAAHPAKFSPEDPYGEYRRKAKLAEILSQTSTSQI
ncbi:MAG: hypothetical protein B7L53_09775 [Thermofilum sp. NZ13]|nr:MAG: hypothetical protein B7L53_09775 [Thermofilum sp. NZ13]